MTRPVALVTGAARGIGAATVRRLVADGYAVLAVDGCAGDDTPAGVDYPLATREDLEEVVATAGGPGHATAHVADVRDRAAVDAAVAAAVEGLGRLDVVVAGAAVVAGGAPQWETDAAVLDTLWQTDLVGVWNTAAATLPRLLAADDPARCRFVAIASAAGERGLFGLSAYVVAKHAVVGLVRGLAADLAGTGVTAVAVAPGSTRTPMLGATADLYGLASVDDLGEHQLLHRVLDPDELAATIAFCCSPAGAVLNGSVVSAGGGFTG